jgi:hypothetical protein
MTGTDPHHENGVGRTRDSYGTHRTTTIGSKNGHGDEIGPRAGENATSDTRERHGVNSPTQRHGQSFYPPECLHDMSVHMIKRPTRPDCS